ncbi:hypothetical protein N7492_001935 [Penicillium capsulatum]|uniref:Uncharacterized protein n=1 Tax=Penicillium capsulatum TaxID=69766 RepID=A0A9W9IKI6_9EURO|nr:hypothetical protein N7492_001935 [Penicillium capsulatum]KAJ6123442.1 hypothetical protein N7512_005907 [Penicillium capsulatum]
MPLAAKRRRQESLQHTLYQIRVPPGSASSAHSDHLQFPESSCPRCEDRGMLQCLTRPRPSRVDSPSRSPSSTSSASSTATSITSNSPSTMADVVPPPKEAAEGLTSRDPSPGMEETLSLQDLELIMYWCTTTYRSMARDVGAEVLWQTVIPQLSLRVSSLRHGLLALSALQLAGTNPRSAQRSRYLSAAREHQVLALEEVRTEGLQDLTMAQCNAHFALYCVLTAFSFARCLIDDRPADEDGPAPPEVLDEFMEVFERTRWLVGGMMLNMNRIVTGELYPLVCPEKPRPTMPDMSRLVILSLRRKNEMQALRDPSHEKEVYAEALEHLSNALEQLMKGGEPKDFAFCWAFRIPVRFQDLVRARQPFALVVLAHYAVILHHLREYWWMGDWAIRILQEIVDALDPEWRELISWPVDSTGVCPSGDPDLASESVS